MNETVAARLSALLEAIANCERSGNDEWKVKHGDRLAETVSAHLPSGSGWDCGTTLDRDASTPDKLVFHGSFHHMNENGSYDGWTEHAIIVRPAFRGFYIRITGRDRNEIKEYLDELFRCALSTVIDQDGKRVAE